MSHLTISTPRGSIVVGPNGKAELSWSMGFGPKWTKKYTEAQRFVDSEVLRLCEPYTPLKTGMLVLSGTLGTRIGSGLVEWIAPYARYQYYLKRKTKSETGPLRGSFWFQRMKERYGATIIAQAQRIAGGTQ